MLFKYTDADGYDYGLGLPLIAMITVVLLTAFIMNFTSGKCMSGTVPEPSGSDCSRLVYPERNATF